MEKKDLKDGLVVEFRNSKLALIVNEDMVGLDTTISDFDEYDDNLLYDGYSETSMSWDIIRIYKVNPAVFITGIQEILNLTNLTLIWDRDRVSKIKPIGYEFHGYKLGDAVTYKGIAQHIVGFDERGISIYDILITSTTETDETMEFKDAKDITSSLDVADTQLVNWVSIKEIEESIKNPKAKYVKVIKCSSKDYWYNKNIGDIFKVYSQGKGLYDVYDNSDKSNRNLINSNDCVVISKNDLMQKGCKVKFKKNINEKYLWNIPKKEIEEFGNKVFTVTSYSEKEDYDDFTSVQIDNENYHFDIRLLKPVLIKGE